MAKFVEILDVRSKFGFLGSSFVEILVVRSKFVKISLKFRAVGSKFGFFRSNISCEVKMFGLKVKKCPNFGFSFKKFQNSLKFGTARSIFVQIWSLKVKILVVRSKFN